MKVIKVQDQLHAQLAAAAKANDRTIGAEIEALLVKGNPTQEVYSDYIKDLFNRVERLTVALEAAMSAKTQATTQPQAEAPTTGRLPCCNGSKPCKHWVWDTSSGDRYVNTITGEYRELN